MRLLTSLKERLLSSKVGRNTVWMFIAIGGRTLFQALYVILLAKMLGPQDFGSFMAIIALFTMIIPFIDIGESNVLIMKVARKPEQFSVYFGSTLFSLLTGSLILGSLTVLISSYLYHTTLLIIILLTLGELIIGKFIEIIGKCFQAFELLSFTAFINVLVSFLKVLSILVILIFNGQVTLEIFSWYYLSTNLIVAVTGYFLVLKKLGRPQLNLVHLKDDIKDGMHFAVGTTSKTIYSELDKVMLNGFVSAEITGIYSAASKIINLTFTPIQALLTATYARFFRYGSKDIANTYHFGKRITRITALYGLSIAILIWICAPLVPLVLGQGYASTVEVLYYLSLIPFLQSIYYPLSDVLTGAGYQSYRSYIQVAAVVLNVGLNVILIPLLSWKGAALSAIISQVFICASIAIFLFLLFKRSKAKRLSNVEIN
ncbi:oligosaccharide flippase family protein [Paenibacillus sp. 1P03SA]|uniref:oligosaccharide flippase family protein n=1 Tax=Paenibacillus sp. 1P03SA TaxID=3132294 RepID=UPI0039A32D1C